MHALLPLGKALDFVGTCPNLLTGTRVPDRDDAVVVLAELVADRRVRLLEVQAHRPVVHLIDLVGIDRRQAGRSKQSLLGIADAPQRVDDVVRAQRLAVVERDPLLEPDDPFVGSLLGHGLGKAGRLQLVVLVVFEQGFEAGDQPRLVGLGRDLLSVDDVTGAATRDAKPEVATALWRASARGR